VGPDLIALVLPFPPSVNRYWRVSPRGRGVLLSKEGREYRRRVRLQLVGWSRSRSRGSGLCMWNSGERLPLLALPDLDSTWTGRCLPLPCRRLADASSLVWIDGRGCRGHRDGTGRPAGCIACGPRA
jgi:hypothetical protein